MQTLLIPLATLTVAIALLAAALAEGGDSLGILFAADLVTAAGIGGALLATRTRAAAVS